MLYNIIQIQKKARFFSEKSLTFLLKAVSYVVMQAEVAKWQTH